MREILFRGQRVDNEEWVYGSFVSYEKTFGIIEKENTEYTCDGSALEFLYTEVRFETVSQFSGLLDKNGNKIFEGDIDKSGMIIMFHNNAFQLCSLVCKEVIQAIPLWCFDNKTFDQIEIIGNIHEEK